MRTRQAAVALFTLWVAVISVLYYRQFLGPAARLLQKLFGIR